MPREIETKFKLKSPTTFKKKLRKIGAKFVSKNLEQDIYYKNLSKRISADVIRLRRIGKKGIFTVKNRINNKDSHTYKVRNELEITIDDAKLFPTILHKLGFRVFFRKEKIRETYEWKNANILIDKLPHMGYFAEIEASKNKIKKIAQLLNLSIKKATSKNYIRLFNTYKTQHKKPKLELLFTKRK